MTSKPAARAAVPRASMLSAATRIIAKTGTDDFQGTYAEFNQKVGEVRLDR